MDARTIRLMKPSRKPVRICALLLAGCLGLAPAAFPQAKGNTTPAPKTESHPDFSGTWVMDLTKSDFGGVDPPSLLRYVVRHRGANLVLFSTQDSVTKRLDIITDGQERVTEEDADSEIWARVYWDGQTLVWEGRRKAKPAHQVEPVNWTSRWSLSDDGKVLNVKRQINMAEGTLEQSIQLEKK